MNEVLEFCKNHWQLLVTIGLNLISILILLIKKKVKIVDYLTGLLSILPSYINEAENTGKSGSEKYALVFSKCINYLVEVTGKTSEKVIWQYSKAIDTSIENILSTPEKKGD